LGQLIRVSVIQGLDVVVGLAALFVVIKRLPEPPNFKYLKEFLLIAEASWFLSVFLFRDLYVLYGLFYFVRLIAYFLFYIYVWNIVKNSQNIKNRLINFLLSISLISAFFGWIQYFIFPSIKPLFVYGWDDHLFRLVGTFLDPAFIGIIIVFGLLTSIIRMIEVKEKKYIIASGFLIMSLAFTYSRASYLAFFAGLLVILWHFKKLKYFLIGVTGFFLIMLILPTSGNRILSFTRQFSAVNRLENYKETIEIFKSSPLFGVGYDNLCLAKEKTDGYFNYFSHACSGSDSSLLLILATTGITGFIIFVYALWHMALSLKNSSNFLLISSTFVALLIHSLFTNSLFYPVVLGWMAILLAIAI
jgi:hypothetical protein